MCAITSPFYWFPSRYISPAALLLWADDRRDHLQYARITPQLPRSAFSRRAGHSWLHDCAKPHWFDFTTLAANWPIVLAILLVTLLSSAIVVGYWCAIAHRLEIPVPGFFSCGAAAMVAMAQDYGADIRLGGVYAISASAVRRGAAVLVTRMMLGDNAEAVNQQISSVPASEH
nr:hypothetical protein [Escherichia coli]